MDAWLHQLLQPLARAELPTSCRNSPEWLQRYLDQQRRVLGGGRPGSVAPAELRYQPNAANGLGNRVTHILHALFLAVLSDRALVLDYGTFTTGSEIDYLKPALIRWDASELRPGSTQQAQLQQTATQQAARPALIGRGNLSTRVARLLSPGYSHAVPRVTLGGRSNPPALREYRKVDAQLRAALTSHGLDAALEDPLSWKACALQALFKTSPHFSKHLASATKHSYRLSRTVQIPAPYLVHCEEPRCSEIAQARRSPHWDAGGWDAGAPDSPLLNRSWAHTEVRSGWGNARLRDVVASAANVSSAQLMRAAQRSIHPRHCPSAELIIIWLAKLVLVRQALIEHPQQQSFAYVDAGYTRYRYSPSVPPAPWLSFEPSPSAVAAMHHPKACHNDLRGTSFRQCLVGTWLYGSRHAWWRLIRAFLSRIRALVLSEETWGVDGHKMLCLDQDIWTEIVLADPSLVELLVAPKWTWGWGELDRICRATAAGGNLGVAECRGPRWVSIPKATGAVKAASARRWNATSIKTRAAVVPVIHQMIDQRPIACAAAPAAAIAAFSFMTNTTGAAGLNSYARGIRALGNSLATFSPALKRHLMLPNFLSLSVDGWSSCHVEPLRPLLHRTTKIGNRWRDTFSKFALFSLTQFGRLLFLDADTIVAGSLEGLLSWPMPNHVRIAACRDVLRPNGPKGPTYWGPGFNSGVMIIRPDAIFAAQMLADMRADKVSYLGTYSGRGTDQEFLNAYPGIKSNWAEIPVKYGANLIFAMTNSTVWEAAKPWHVVHFTMQKPWRGCFSVYKEACALWRPHDRPVTGMSGVL